MVAVNSVLALHARLAGCPIEALAALAHACAVYSVQADPISKADILGFPWAGLALRAKEARTALSRLKRKDEAGSALPFSGFVQLRCRNPAAGMGCVTLALTSHWSGCEDP